MPRARADAVVLGAGAAGLSAARELSAAGLEVVVLEARERVGGRIHSVRDAAVARPIELGAEFVHGRSPGLFELFSAAGVVPEEVPDDHLLSSDGRLSPVDDFWGKVEALGRDLARWLGRQDRPLSDYLSRARLPPRTRALLEEFVEGFYAARLDRISARSLASGGDALQRQFRPAGGYGPAIRWLRAALDPRRVEVRLGTRATAVRWSRGEVVVEAAGPSGRALEPFRARAAVVTLPHALLRSNAVPFSPALEGRRGALERIETGQVFKIVMRFRESFWDDDAFVRRRLSRKIRDPAPLNFVHGEAPVPVWWTSLPARLPLWTGWAGGPKAETILSAAPTSRADRALDALSTLLDVPRRTLDDRLDGTWAHDWRADPFSKGAYAYAGVGGLSAQKVLARPVEGTLFFAGEALSRDVGTVPGALDSGRRAGRAAAERLRA